MKEAVEQESKGIVETDHKGNRCLDSGQGASINDYNMHRRQLMPLFQWSRVQGITWPFIGHIF